MAEMPREEEMREESTGLGWTLTANPEGREALGMTAELNSYSSTSDPEQRMLRGKGFLKLLQYWSPWARQKSTSIRL